VRPYPTAPGLDKPTPAMVGILERIQAKIELFRLEQRYTRRHRRSTFVSNAIYVDGEYIYQTPASTGSSANTSTTNTSSPVDDKPGKHLSRYWSMPGFGSLSKASGSSDWGTRNASADGVR